MTASRGPLAREGTLASSRDPSRVTLVAAIAFALFFGLWSSPSAAESGPSETDHSRDLPDDGWRYGTYYLYPLTRHIGESEVSKPWRHAMLPFTVVLDTAQLPFGAIAGLFGD